MKGNDDLLVRTKPLRQLIRNNWSEFLSNEVSEVEVELLRKHERTGRPLGAVTFIEKMELLLNRRLRPRKPGPKKKKNK